jgi:tripartite-type tricarboxylate transporter receptor subunit TctC
MPRAANLQRRRLLAAACAVLTPGLGRAQPPAPYPSRPIMLLVPWPAGGQTDITMRILAELASRQLGQPMIIENRPGAAGTMVGPAMHAAVPDGYLVAQLPITLYRAPLQRKVNWDPLREIQPVIQISGVTFGIVVPADSPFQNFGDLVAWGRDNPGYLSVGSTGIGSTAHLAMEDVMSREGVRYLHIPYKGTADQMLAVAGHTLMVGVNSTGFAPYVESGRLRLLAVFNAQRSKRWPNVPTLRELGHPQAVYTSPYGIGVPAGTDAAIVRRLHDAFKVAMFDPLHLQEIAKYDQDPAYLDTADYTRFIQDVVQRERQLLARLGLLPLKAE